MGRDKQALLKRHRRRKRGLLIAGLLAALASAAIHWTLPALVGTLLWVAHEAWGSDHLFYSPQQDHVYHFGGAASHPARLDRGALSLPEGVPDGDTLVLELVVRANMRGRLLDPYVVIGDERFDFERGAAGRRYLDISQHRDTLTRGGLVLGASHCTIEPDMRITAFAWPDFTQRRVMIIAPHADDAELAAFGLYSSCDAPLVVTVTQGETEADALAAAFGIDLSDAARLKGRLRSWDSVCTPLWGGVPMEHSLQLGYYCMQLNAMRLAPDMPHASRDCGDADIRIARRWNSRSLPGDADGLPTWTNLIADLSALIDDFQPEVVVTPHPARDPHPDHVAATQALHEALTRSTARPEHVLFYANHLHDNDRWPMGPAGGGQTLPPAFDASVAGSFWSISLTPAAQRDKALALGMQHDLQRPLSVKKRVRRAIQRVLAGRDEPLFGNNPYFRKAVRSRELFQVQICTAFLDNSPREIH